MSKHAEAIRKAVENSTEMSDETKTDLLITAKLIERQAAMLRITRVALERLEAFADHAQPSYEVIVANMRTVVKQARSDVINAGTKS